MASLKMRRNCFVLICLIAVVAVIYGSGSSSMTICIFCDIVSKKTETELLYEDEVSLILKQFK